MSEGYIKVHRKITEWEWYSDKNTTRLFIHLLCTVNWKEAKFQGVTVPIGARITSIQKLSEETGLTRQEVRTALAHLKKTGEINTQSTRNAMLVTVENYTIYQTSAFASNTPSNTRLTRHQHGVNTQLTPIEERNKGRREECNNTTPLTPQLIHFSELLSEKEIEILALRLGNQFLELCDELSPCNPQEIGKPLKYALSAAKRKGYI